ncbi:MAG: GxxExxY protein [Bacteroidota bacterium]
MELLHKDITNLILRTYYDVYNELGYGFLERVYQNAMCFELEKQGLKVESQKPIKVFYKEKLVGEYFADLLINDTVIIELKANEVLVSANEIQLLNYLRATNIEVGLLLNFGKKPESRRKIFTNNLKNQ